MTIIDWIKNFSVLHPIISLSVSWVIKIISAVGLLTLLEIAFYFWHSYDYENIIVTNVDSLSFEEVNEQYDVIEKVDFDKKNKFDNHKKIIVGPQESLMEDIEFSKMNEQMNGYNKINTQLHINDLEPQQYLFLRVPTTDLTGVIKMEFDINFKKGEYLFSPNMRNGHEDKVVLKVKKTLASFINK